MRKFTIRSLLTAMTFTVAAASASAVLAVDYGNVEGQFVLAGDIPKLDPKVTKGDQTAKDAAVCAVEAVPNTALVADPKTKGIANIIVYLRKAPADVYPEQKSSAEKEVEFDQKGCQYLPHVLLLRTDQTVICSSQDAVSHNVHTHPFSNDPKNFIVTPNAKKGGTIDMKSAEGLPVQVTCDIHPWMSLYWVVTDHPYAAVTDEEGKFRIENLPVGKHKFVVWQESAGYVDRALEVDVKKGDNSIPVQKVPLSKFKLGQ